MVTIVDATNPNVGKWYPVVQTISSNPPTFLMQNPLPLGRYAICITPGFVQNEYTGNTLDLTGKSSAGITLTSQFGARIAGNTIIVVNRKRVFRGITVRSVAVTSRIPAVCAVADAGTHTGNRDTTINIERQIRMMRSFQAVAARRSSPAAKPSSRNTDATRSLSIGVFV